MKNCILLEKNFDMSLVRLEHAVFHRTFSKRQPYNRSLEDKYDAIPTSTYLLPQEVTLNLLSQLPKKVLELEIPQVFILKVDPSDSPFPILAAHVDLNRSCGINIYIEANGERTHYYDWDSTTKTLSETECFIAKKGECWLMDTTIPHSVSLVTGMQRVMLTFSFVKSPYQTVKNLFEINHE